MVNYIEHIPPMFRPNTSAYVEMPVHPGCEKFISAANNARKLRMLWVHPGNEETLPAVTTHNPLQLT